MKESTRKLCRQLQDNPDVEGNNAEISKHKDKLVDWVENLKTEIMGPESTFKNFKKDIESELLEQQAFE